MTNKEAIEEIEHTVECCKMYLAKDGPWILALNIAISALRAQQAPLDRSRLEGCEYCADHKYNVELCPMLSHDEDDCDRGMYIYDGCLISNSGEFQEAKINFCPMCGRPLTKEARAELERGMNDGTID